MRIAAILIPIWLCAWFVTWGFLNADSQCRFHNLDRRDLAATDMFWAMIPPIQVLSVFMTGFYEHGWQLSITHCEAEEVTP
jgi:hypothetical protein